MLNLKIKNKSMNNIIGGYIPKSRIEKITTTSGTTIGRNKLRDGNAISDTPIKGRRVSSDNDSYLSKSEIKSIKTTDGRVIKREFIKDGNFLKEGSKKHPKISRTQFEDEEYSYKVGGSVDSETQKKIDGIEKFINNPENQKNDPATVEKFKNILASIKPKASTPAEPKAEPKATASTEPKAKAGRPKGTSTPKATATPKAEPKAEPKTKTSKGVKVTGSSTVTIDGKEVDMNSAEFCSYLLKQFRDRREKSKNAPKKKTASVMAKITANVEKSVVQAIKSSVASNKKAIEKNPDFFVKKVEKLETSTKSFLQSMKDVLGDDFKEGEIASTIKSIEELTESLVAKYKTK